MQSVAASQATDYGLAHSPVDRQTGLVRSQLDSPVMAAEVARLLDKLVVAQRQHQLFPRRPDGRPLTVVVGVSGGADSICLLYALAQVATEWRLLLHVAHLDHNLRSESAADAAFVAQIAAALDCPLHRGQLADNQLQGQPGGLEASARQARYTFLLRTTINVTPPDQVPLLVLAHHADDQAETVLLNLMRGSGLQGLGGMRPLSQVDLNQWDWREQRENVPALKSRLVQVVRPLLQVRRAEIIAYLQSQHLAWREDSSNQDTTLLRNRVRHIIMPELAAVNPAIVETLGRTAQVLAGEAERIQLLDRTTLTELMVLADSALGVSTETAPLGRIVLDLDQLRALDLASQRGVLRQALAHLQPGLRDIGFETIERLLDQLRAHPQASGPHPLLDQLAWSVAGASLAMPANWLSLHRADGLPFLPPYPYLDQAWQQAVRRLTLPSSGAIQLADSWTLQVELLPIARLPIDWRQLKQPWQAYLDAEQTGTLVLTTPQPGMRFAPLGMQGQQQTLGDFFTNRKIPASLRRGWPLLFDSDHNTVIWVCGLRPAHQARITEQTRHVLHLAWKRIE